MKTILKGAIFKNNILVKTFKKDFKSADFDEKVIPVNNQKEEGSFKEIRLDGILLTIRDFKMQPYEISVSHNFPFFKLQFEIEGSSLYTPNHPNGQAVYIPGGHYNLFYIPEVNGVLSYQTHYRKTLEIQFTEKHIKKIIGDDFKHSLKKFGDAIRKKETFLMWEKSKPISQKLQDSINEIIDCNYSESLKKAFLEVKINAILITLLAQTNETNYQKTKAALLNEEQHKLIEVEQYISANLNEPLPIQELAKMAGMNATKLKKQFKLSFGSPIFKYISNARMKTARTMILEKGYTVAEAAYEVGYKYPQHFTVAFKKTYGYLPSTLTKEND